MTQELILTSSLDELKELANSKGIVFTPNVTKHALQGLLFDKLPKVPDELQIVYQYQDLVEVEE